MKLFALVGKFALFLAAMALLTGVSFFVVGAYVVSWPIMRVSPRSRRVQALMGLGVAVVTAARAYGLENRLTEAATDDTEDTGTLPGPNSMNYPYGDGDVTVLGPECFITNDGSVLNWRGENFVPQNLDSTASKLEGGDNDTHSLR